MYKVKDKNTNEYRAIKIINKKEIKDQLKTEYMKDDIEEEFLPFVDSFLNEIKNMEICSQNNSNNNSIKYYENYNTDSDFVIVMELCDSNLQSVLNKRKTGFNSQEIYDILTQLNNTFKIMSDNKIIHRDIKLENILVTNANGEKSKYIIKLTDYGVSKQLMSFSRICKTHAGTVLTMAPEILNEEEYNNKCDLWSIGVIIYQLYFKQYPYSAKTECGLINQINNQKQSRFKKTEDLNLDNLISKLLRKEPSERLSWEQYFNHPFFNKEKK